MAERAAAGVAAAKAEARARAREAAKIANECAAAWAAHERSPVAQRRREASLRRALIASGSILPSDHLTPLPPALEAAPFLALDADGRAWAAVHEAAWRDAHRRGEWLS